MTLLTIAHLSMGKPASLIHRILFGLPAVLVVGYIADNYYFYNPIFEELNKKFKLDGHSDAKRVKKYTSEGKPAEYSH